MQRSDLTEILRSAEGPPALAPDFFSGVKLHSESRGHKGEREGKGGKGKWEKGIVDSNDF